MFLNGSLNQSVAAAFVYRDAAHKDDTNQTSAKIVWLRLVAYMTL